MVLVCLTGQQTHHTWTHRESMGYCQEENEKQETKKCRWAEGHCQRNLGFHTAVPQTDHLRATRCGGILAHSSWQNCCNSATLEGFRAWTAFLRSCHSISIGFRSGLWLGHSKSLHFVFLQPFRGGFAGVFWIIVLLQNPSSLQLAVTNRWPDIVLQDFLVDSRIHGSIYHSKSSRSWSSKTAPDHHTTTTIFYCWYDVLFLKCCVTFTPDVMGHTPSKKFNFWLVSPQSIFPKVLGIIKMFSDKTEMSFYVLFAQQRFSSWNSAMKAIFAQSLSYGGVMNTDLNWGKWGLQFFRCCCGVFCDLLDESSLCSWGNVGRPATPGKVHHCSMFSPFVDNGSHCGSLESQSFRNGFITFSRLIDLNYFLSHLFLNFFGSQHDV